jgi:hypothetical protein
MTMKKLTILGSLLFATLIVAQVAINWKAGQRSILDWDAPTTNADGTPCDDLAGFRAAISLPDVDLNATTTPLPAPIATVDVPGAAVSEVALTGLLTGLAKGNYRLWVLAYDDVGNESEWSEPLPIFYDPVKPGRPVSQAIRK